MSRGGAVVADGTPETVEADLVVMPRRVRESLLRQLAESERVVLRTRQHPAALARSAVWPLVTAWAWWWLAVRVGAAPPLVRLVQIAFAVGLVVLGWRTLHWHYRWLVATNKRILRHEGFFGFSVPMMRLTKVTDMTYRRSLLGELLGYGTIIIESAGQQQAIRDLTFIPDSDRVSAALNSEIFDERPRARKGRKNRGWPRLPTRYRGEDPPPSGPSGDGGGSGGGGGRGGPSPRRGPGSGGVRVSPTGHPPPPRPHPETWYRSSNLGGPSRLGDTGEIPVVRAEDVERWQRERAGDPDEVPLYPPPAWVEDPT